MSWIVEVTVKAVETESGLSGANRMVGIYSFSATPVNGNTLAAAWAGAEGEVHSRFLARMEPSKGDA